MSTPGGKSDRLTGWRRIAAAMWPPPDDPQIFASIDVDADPIQRFIADRKARGEVLTPTHLVARGVALALRAVPELNVRIVGGRAIARPSVDIFFTASVERGRELSGVKIEAADAKSAVAIAAELKERLRAAKRHGDPGLEQSKRLLDKLPMPLVRGALRLLTFLVDDRAISIDRLGLAASPFGSAVVTSVGMFGLPGAFAPIPWISPVPVLVLVGAVVDRPVAVGKRVEVRSVLPLHATIDHRYVDGSHVARALRAFRAYVAEPAAFEPKTNDEAVGSAATTKP